MGKISLVGETPKTDKLEELRDWIANLTTDIVNQINGNLLFGDNVKCNILEVDFTAANSDKTIRHNLGKIPVGYWMIETNNPTSLFTGTVSANTQTITLQSSAIATTKVLVI